MIIKLENIILLFCSLFLLNCGKAEHKLTQVFVAEEPNLIEATGISLDTLELSKAFENLRHDPKFIKKMLLDDGFAEMGEIDEERLFGDLNGDGISDAIIPYMVNNRGGGNNWTIHYAIFLGEGESKWNYVGTFHSGGSASEYYVVLNKIDNGNISGYHTQYRNSDYRDKDFPATYIYQNGDLVKTFLKLNNAEYFNGDVFYIETIQTSNNQNIPTVGAFKDYQNILGEKDVEWPEEEPEECGPYYDYEDFAGFVYYPFLTMEINRSNEAAVVSIDLKGSDYKIQTNKGTITEKTHLNEILSIFGDQMEINRSDNDVNKILDLRIPIERYNTKDVWILSFNDEDNTLESIFLFIGCK